MGLHVLNVNSHAEFDMPHRAAYTWTTGKEKGCDWRSDRIQWVLAMHVRAFTDS